MDLGGNNVNWKIKRIAIDIVIIIIISLISISLTNTSQVNAGNIEEETPIYCVDTENKDICLTFDAKWLNADTLHNVKWLPADELILDKVKNNL